MGYDRATLSWLETRNLENLIHTYFDSLKQIQFTGKLPKHWTLCDRRHMRKHDIIKLKGSRSRVRWILTPKALEIINGGDNK